MRAVPGRSARPSFARGSIGSRRLSLGREAHQKMLNAWLRLVRKYDHPREIGSRALLASGTLAHNRQYTEPSG